MASFRLMTRVVATALALVVITASSAAQAPQFRARLSPVPLDIAMQATIAGSGSATASLKGTTLTISGTFAGLKTPATAARLHRGPKTAMRGPAIGDLTVTAATSGSITGSLEVTGTDRRPCRGRSTCRDTQRLRKASVGMLLAAREQMRAFIVAVSLAFARATISAGRAPDARSLPRRKRGGATTIKQTARAPPA